MFPVSLMKLALWLRAACLLAAWMALTLVAAWLLEGAYRRSWELSLAVGQECQAELEAIDVPRPALWGATEERASLEEYRRAATLMFGENPLTHSTQVDSFKTGLDDWAWRGSGSRAVSVRGQYRQLLESPRGRQAFGALRSGAHSDHAGSAAAWLMGENPWMELGALHALSLAAAYRADLAREAGDSLDAARWNLDRTRMGLDLLRAPGPKEQMLGLSILEDVVVDRGYWAGTPGFGASQAGREWNLALPRIIGELEAYTGTSAGVYLRHLGRNERRRDLESWSFFEAHLVRAESARSSAWAREALPRAASAKVGIVMPSDPARLAKRFRSGHGGRDFWLLRAMSDLDNTASAPWARVMDAYRAWATELASEAKGLGRR